MKAFEVVFICSTNLIDDLDQASFRRFALKIHFDYMAPRQRRAMFATTIKDMAIKGGSSRKKNWLDELDGLDLLTPGDFATVRRKAALLGNPESPGELLTFF